MNKLIGLLSCMLLLASPLTSAQTGDKDSVYELRIYTAQPGRLPDVLARFKNHTCKLFERHGMVNVGYWLPLEQKDGDKLYYLLKHKSRAAAEASWAAFRAD